MPTTLSTKFKSFFARVFQPLNNPFIKHFISMVSNILVTPRTAMQVSGFYRGLIFLSSSIAKLPLEFKDANNKIIDNKLSYLFNISPNPEMNAFNFKLAMIQTAVSKGNFYAEIERNVLGDPQRLWPIPSENVDPYRDPVTGKFYWRVTGSSASQYQDILLDPMDVFHISNLHTEDGIVGQGVVAYAQNTLGISLGSDRFTNGLYANAGLPSSVIKFKGKMDNDTYKRLKESYKENHTGKKVGGTMFLEDGAEYQAISHDPESMQYIEQKEFSVEEIARFLGVPLSKLFSSKGAKYNNQEQSNLEFVTDTVIPWTSKIENEVKMKLIRSPKEKCEHNLFQITKGDMDTRAKYYTARMQTASITPNQIKKLEGEQPYDGGDRYYIASNNFTPIDRQDEIIDAQIESKETKDPTEDPEDKAINKKLNQKALAFLERN